MPSTDPGVAGMGDCGDAVGGARDAADGRQDPDLVARADPAVGAAIALEPGRRVRGPRRRGVGRVAIGARRRSSRVSRLWLWTWQPAPIARVARPIGQPNLRTSAPASRLLERHLVALRESLRRFRLRPRMLARRERPQRRGDVVAGVEPQRGGRFRGGRDRVGLRHWETGVRLKPLAMMGKAAYPAA